MALLWKDDLATGVELIDEQHKELFARIEQLLAACNQGKGKEEVTNTLDFLAEYIEIHFTAEEELQRNSGYPEYEAHKAIHDKWVEEISQLREQLAKDGPTVRLVLQVNRKVVDWLTQHIRKVDKRLAEYLRSQ
ncbi:MAG: hemerythrin family protein [Firmicutes bacterium]|nr:hemerythrin family protein [Bacillota bacterium]